MVYFENYYLQYTYILENEFTIKLFIHYQLNDHFKILHTIVCNITGILYNCYERRKKVLFLQYLRVTLGKY